MPDTFGDLRALSEGGGKWDQWALFLLVRVDELFDVGNGVRYRRNGELIVYLEAGVLEDRESFVQGRILLRYGS